MAERWIDVSAHNGVIDWHCVAASGIKGAVIRAGYGDDIRQQDTQFSANIRGAISAGLKVAVYWFSYADSIADARKEWAVCRQIIGPYKNNILFVASDYEYASYNYYRRLHGAAPSVALINQMVCAFLSAVKSDGWGTALYTNNDYRRNIFSAETFRAWPVWLADYTGGPDVPCMMQQTGSAGRVPGIAGNVDMDMLLKEIGGAAVQIDTTMDVTIPRGRYYTFKTVCGQCPAVTVGTANVVALLHCRREGNTDYWHLCAVGEPGSAAGIYTAASGEKPLKRFVVKIK